MRSLARSRLVAQGWRALSTGGARSTASRTSSVITTSPLGNEIDSSRKGSSDGSKHNSVQTNGKFKPRYERSEKFPKSTPGQAWNWLLSLYSVLSRNEASGVGIDVQKSRIINYCRMNQPDGKGITTALLYSAVSKMYYSQPPASDPTWQPVADAIVKILLERDISKEDSSTLQLMYGERCTLYPMYLDRLASPDLTKAFREKLVADVMKNPKLLSPSFACWTLVVGDSKLLSQPDMASALLSCEDAEWALVHSNVLPNALKGCLYLPQSPHADEVFKKILNVTKTRVAVELAAGKPNLKNFILMVRVYYAKFPLASRIKPLPEGFTVLRDSLPFNSVTAKDVEPEPAFRAAFATSSIITKDSVATEDEKLFWQLLSSKLKPARKDNSSLAIEVIGGLVAAYKRASMISPEKLELLVNERLEFVVPQKGRIGWLVRALLTTEAGDQPIRWSASTVKKVIEQVWLPWMGLTGKEDEKLNLLRVPDKEMAEQAYFDEYRDRVAKAVVASLIEATDDFRPYKASIVESLTYFLQIPAAKSSPNIAMASAKLEKSLKLPEKAGENDTKIDQA